MWIDRGAKRWMCILFRKVKRIEFIEFNESLKSDRQTEDPVDFFFGAKYDSGKEAS